MLRFEENTCCRHIRIIRYTGRLPKVTSCRIVQQQFKSVRPTSKYRRILYGRPATVLKLLIFFMLSSLYKTISIDLAYLLNICFLGGGPGNILVVILSTWFIGNFVMFVLPSIDSPNISYKDIEYSLLCLDSFHHISLVVLKHHLCQHTARLLCHLQTCFKKQGT